MKLARHFRLGLAAACLLTSLTTAPAWAGVSDTNYGVSGELEMNGDTHDVRGCALFEPRNGGLEIAVGSSEANVSVTFDSYTERNFFFFGTWSARTGPSDVIVARGVHLFFGLYMTGNVNGASGFTLSFDGFAGGSCLAPRDVTPDARLQVSRASHVDALSSVAGDRAALLGLAQPVRRRLTVAEVSQ